MWRAGGADAEVIRKHLGNEGGNSRTRLGRLAGHERDEVAVEGGGVEVDVDGDRLRRSVNSAASAASVSGRRRAFSGARCIRDEYGGFGAGGPSEGVAIGGSGVSGGVEVEL